MRLSIRHTTRYAYDQPVAHGLLRLRMRPKPTHGQQVIDWTMDLDGARFETEFDDHHHNHINLVSIGAGAPSLEITCSGTIETSDKAGILGPHHGSMPLWAFERTHAGVGIQRHHHRITQGAGIRQVAHMAGMQQIEATIGKDQFFALCRELIT